MSHSHQYSFWHAHEHGHWQKREEPEAANISVYDYHDTGHYHIYAQTHEHGLKSSLTPHSHKAKQYHPETDEENEIHHHAPADHKPLDWDASPN